MQQVENVSLWHRHSSGVQKRTTNEEKPSVATLGSAFYIYFCIHGYAGNVRLQAWLFFGLTETMCFRWMGEKKDLRSLYSKTSGEHTRKTKRSTLLRWVIIPGSIQGVQAGAVFPKDLYTLNEIPLCILQYYNATQWTTPASLNGGNEFVKNCKVLGKWR